MPTIIDSLLVTLGIDGSNFAKGKDQVNKGLKELKDNSKSTNDSFKEVTKTAAEFLAVIGGAYEIKRFIQDQIEANAALDRLSKNLNESVTDISAWSNAVESAGGSAQGLQGTMDMLSRAQTEFQLTGQSGLIPYLSALGLNLADVGTEANGVGNFLLTLSDRFSHMNRTTANNMGRMMGIDQGTMQLLLKGRAEVELYIKRQKESNAVTEAQAAEATKLRGAIINVQQSFESFGRELLQDASPALEKLFAVFQDFVDWCKSNKQLVEDFLTVVAVGLGAIGLAVLPINLTVVAVTALAGALALLWQDYQTWKAGGDSLINWKPGIDLATAGLRVMKDVLIDVLYRIAGVGSAINSLLVGDWQGAKEGAEAVISGKPSPTGPTGSAARDQFINAAASRLGVPTSAIDAQLRLETGGTGSKTVGNYNYGNIKAGSNYGGATVSALVPEYANGQKYMEMSKFRSYSSPEEAAADYAAMIARKFPGAVGAKTATAFAQGLQEGGYATDPNYVNKVSNIAAGIPGASSAAQGVGPSNLSGIFGGNRSVQTTIGNITIHTQAKDADGIAKDMGVSLDHLFTAQANYGLTP